MNLACGEFSVVAPTARIGCKVDTDTAPDKRHSERFGGKKMSASAAGGEEDDFSAVLS